MSRLALELHSGSPPTDLKAASAVLCPWDLRADTAAAVRASGLPTWVRMSSPHALPSARQSLGRVDVAVLPSLEALLEDALPDLGLECFSADQVQGFPGLKGILAEVHPLALHLETALLGTSTEVMARLPSQHTLFHTGPSQLRQHRAQIGERLEAAFPDFRGHLDWLFLHFAMSVGSLVAVDPCELESMQAGLQVPPPEIRDVRRVALGLGVLHG